MNSPASDESFPTSQPPPYRSRSPSSDDWSSDEDDGLCTRCSVPHVQRRLVICIDGTWMVPDGAIGSFRGNASNIFRIWCMVKLGKVRDASGRAWEQIRAPFIDGVGAVDDFIERVVAGVTGSGFERKILEAYKHCCSLCPADEVFLFGFSRGAFIARAVAGLLHHMGALRPELADFDEKFFKGLRLYRAAQDKSRLLQHSIYRDLRDPPRIKYIGVIDTVKALNDDNLYDIHAFQAVECIRHALALFEKRTVMSPERFDIEQIAASEPSSHSVQEAWFAGTHGNLGGAQEQDGLSLWPLQWVMTEAQRAGLKVGFSSIARCHIADPSGLIRIRAGDVQVQCLSQNGIQTCISDITRTLEQEGFYPWINTGGKSFPSPEEFREVFKNGQLIGRTLDDQSGCFIHPSIFLLDHTDTTIVQAINRMPFSTLLRNEQRFTTLPTHPMFWPLQKELGVRSAAERPRVLVCGQVYSGKTSLINEVLGEESAAVSHGASQGEHDIAVEFQSETSNFVFHDSQGFESGGEENYEAVQSALIERRESPHFSEHVHCIWYCVSLQLPRIQKSDRKFAKLKFGGVPVVLVFTKSDLLSSDATSEALAEHNRQKSTRIRVEDVGLLPQAVKAQINTRAEELQNARRHSLEREWNQRIPIFNSTVFVTLPTRSLCGQESVDQLLQLSVSNMTSERIGKIHADAQENAVQLRLKMMVSETIALCNKKADWWECFKTSDPHQLRRRLAATVIHNAARIFQFEGFRESSLSEVIMKGLYPVQEELSAVNAGIYMASAAVGGGLGGVLEAIFAPLVTLPTLTYLGWRGFKSMEESNVMVMCCVELLLVFDRIFWYGDRRIEERHVRSAVIYYLKIRGKVIEALAKSLDRSDSISRMGPKLTKIIEEFRYRRDLSAPTSNQDLEE